MLKKSLINLTKQRNAIFQSQMQFRSFSAKYENIIVERKEDKIEFIQLNRPKALNALCDALFHELNEAVKAADADP